MTLQFDPKIVPHPVQGTKREIIWPSQGTTVEDPCPNPEFILRYLIELILRTTAKPLSEVTCYTLVDAQYQAMLSKHSSPRPLSFSGRSDAVVQLIDTLITIYNNHKPEKAPDCAVFEGLHPKNRSLVFWTQGRFVDDG